MTTEIKVLKGMLFEQSDGEVVLRGVLAPESLPHLQVDDYQRENLVKSNDRMVKAISAKKHFPDVELGLRGHRWDSDKQDNYTLRNAVYIIDGFQRISALRVWIEQNPGKELPVAQGVKIHFGTTRKTERDLFDLLNGPARRRVSANVLLRNAKEEHLSLFQLHLMCKEDTKFPLYGRVTWTQAAQRSDLITAMVLMKSTAALFKHVDIANAHKVLEKRTASGQGGDERQAKPRQLDRVIKAIGMPHYRRNVAKFWELVEDVWGVRSVIYSTKSTHLRANFLLTLATVLSDHTNFWKEHDLVVDADTRRRLKSFPLNDPEVMRLAGAGTMAISILYNLMVEHLNKRRHSDNRLVKREAIQPYPVGKKAATAAVGVAA